MTIKHSISKIEWASNDYITQLSSTSQLSSRQLEWNVVGKATSGRRGLWAQMSWGPEKMLIRCRKESHHPAEWPLDLQLSIKRTRKTQRDGHKSKGQTIAVSVRSLAPSHMQTLSNPFRTLTIEWEVNIFIKKSSCVRLLFIALVCIQHIYVSCMNMYMRIQQFESSSANQNSLLIRCWFVSIFNLGVPNYFISMFICVMSTYETYEYMKHVSI